MSNTVFVVEYGYYSDRYVLGVWPTREAAEVFIDGRKMETGVTISEHELGVPANGLRPMFVAVIDSGSIRLNDFMELGSSGDAWARRNQNAPGGWYGKALGETEELAIKRLSDAWAKAKAEELEP